MTIKVLALDIYGTVLCDDDYDNNMPPRIGIDKLFEIAKERKIKVVSASDNAPEIVRIELSMAEVDLRNFDKFYHLDQEPFKDFRGIIKDYYIMPCELLVVGDSYKDEAGAGFARAEFKKVPCYHGNRDNFDLSSVL
jgi:hypothetical protein